MPDKNEPLNKSFYDRIIQKKIGEAFFSAGYDPSQPLPRRMRTLLDRLDEPGALDVTSGAQRPDGAPPVDDEWAGRN